MSFARRAVGGNNYWSSFAVLLLFRRHNTDSHWLLRIIDYNNNHFVGSDYKALCRNYGEPTRIVVLVVENGLVAEAPGLGSLDPLGNRWASSMCKHRRPPYLQLPKLCSFL